MDTSKRAWAWSILLLTTLFALSSSSNLATPDIGFHSTKDKIGHFFIFGLLATSILRIECFRCSGLRGTVSAAAIVIVYGALDEFRQSLTPGRAVELADWIADSLGAIVAVATYRTLVPYRLLLEWKVIKPAKRRRSNASN